MCVRNTTSNDKSNSTKCTNCGNCPLAEKKAQQIVQLNSRSN